MKKRIFAFFSALVLGLLLTTSTIAGPRYISAANWDYIGQSDRSYGRATCIASVRTNWGQMDVKCDYWNLSSELTRADMYLSWISGNFGFICPLSGAGGQSGSFTKVCQLPYGPPPWSDSLSDRRLTVRFKTAGYPDGEIGGGFKVVMLDSDVDGDGRSDPAVFRPATRLSYALASFSGNVVSQQFPGYYWENRPLAADFDGDGLADLASCHIDWDTGEWLWIYTRSSDNTLAQTSWGNEWSNDQEAYGDFDGDARMDVAVFRGDSGIWYVIRSSDGQPMYEQFGTLGDRAMPADYDGDGKADLAVVREEAGRLAWYIRRSSDGSFYRIEWGLSTDAIYPGMPADVDGDGTSDIVVGRTISLEPGRDPEQLYFYALRSLDHSWSLVPWGVASDSVRIGDFDGDGRTEFAAVRPIDGHLTWFVSPGRNGAMPPFNWGITGDE